MSRIYANSPFNRLLTWYSIFTVLFRCPPTLEACDEHSPRICKPYFQLKDTVSPHLQPYYDSYAAPYVDLVQPYYTTLEQNVLTPSWGYATKHGKPLVLQGQAYGRAQWDQNLQPLLSKYQALAEARYGGDTRAPCSPGLSSRRPLLRDCPDHMGSRPTMSSCCRRWSTCNCVRATRLRGCFGIHHRRCSPRGHLDLE